MEKMPSNRKPNEIKPPEMRRYPEPVKNFVPIDELPDPHPNPEEAIIMRESQKYEPDEDDGDIRYGSFDSLAGEDAGPTHYDSLIAEAQMDHPAPIETEMSSSNSSVVDADSVADDVDKIVGKQNSTRVKFFGALAWNWPRFRDSHGKRGRERKGKHAKGSESFRPGAE